MTRRYGSTSLRLVQDYCSRALWHSEHDTPQRRDHFAVGTAAHMVLQAMQDARGDRDAELDTDEAAKVADAAAAALVRGGWTHRGQPQPPIRPDDVAEGRELAVQWHGRHGTIPGAVAEVGVTRDDGYGSQLDLTWIEYDEAEDGPELKATVVTRDYKTSWRAGAKDCQSTQMKAAALLAIQWARAQDIEPASVRIEIGAVRTGNIYTHEVWLDDPVLAQWDAYITAVCAGLDAQPEIRPADPSVRCGSCPYLHACLDGRGYIGALGLFDDKATAGRMLARRRAADTDEADLRALLTDKAIDIEGHRVGYQRVEAKVVAKDAPRKLAERWGLGTTWTTDSVAGLLVGMGVGVTAIKAAAKALVPERSKAGILERQEIIDSMLETETSMRWTIKRVNDDDSES